MGRRLDALDERVDARLLQTTPSGFVLTPAGEAIFPSERIGYEAFSVERTISGKEMRLEGTVRVTMTEQGEAVERLPQSRRCLRRFVGEQS
jgi:DNA-binding transcriptional LysR family regulator